MYENAAKNRFNTTTATETTGITFALSDNGIGDGINICYMLFVKFLYFL